MMSFWMAVQFLTRLPTPEVGVLSEAQAARSFCYYPLVGLILGLLLTSVYLAFEGANNWDLALTQTWVVAALIVALWTYLTGGLHLDGLADTVDGWMSGADRARTLEIMRDSHAGAGAVIVVPLLFLLKFTALVHLLTNQTFWPLLIAPVLGRLAILLLAVTTPSARSEGMGQRLKQGLKPGVLLSVIVLSLLAVGLLAGLSVVPILLCSGVALWRFRQWMVQRLGGYTGDTLGASAELIEMVVLLVPVFYL